MRANSCMSPRVSRRETGLSDSATAVDQAWPAKVEAGLQNKLFGYLFKSLFKGLVYPQIWEDPEIDLEALQITPESRVVAIASGGCNILSYLIANPAKITGSISAAPTSRSTGSSSSRRAICRRRTYFTASSAMPTRKLMLRPTGVPRATTRRRVTCLLGTPRLRPAPPSHFVVLAQCLSPRAAGPVHWFRAHVGEDLWNSTRATCSARVRSPSSAATSTMCWRRCSTSGSSAG